MSHFESLESLVFEIAHQGYEPTDADRQFHASGLLDLLADNAALQQSNARLANENVALKRAGLVVDERCIGVEPMSAARLIAQAPESTSNALHTLRAAGLL